MSAPVHDSQQVAPRWKKTRGIQTSTLARSGRGPKAMATSVGLLLAVSVFTGTGTSQAAVQPAVSPAPAATAPVVASREASTAQPVAATRPVLAPKPVATKRVAARKASLSRGARVIRIAASKRGAPYRYGGSGPSVFDCSGFTGWVYKKVGKRLPHSSASQARTARRISRSAARPGDLVFFHSGGRVYHVGIYAGHNQVWHAPYSGARVRKERIWTGSVFFGRVG